MIAKFPAICCGHSVLAHVSNGCSTPWCRCCVPIADALRRVAAATRQALEDSANPPPVLKPLPVRKIIV